MYIDFIGLFVISLFISGIASNDIGESNVKNVTSSDISIRSENLKHNDGSNLNIFARNAPEEIQQNDVVMKKRTKRRWTPFVRSTDDTNETVECSTSIDDFPTFFTHQERLHGAILIPIFVVINCFILIAVICDNYFIPCVERICEALSLSEDVAAATFMSIATSAPELFVNIIGTFITKSDIGIGTIVGSSMFNTLGVASVGGLAAAAPIKIDWWPLTRDCSIYMFAVAFLVVITWDSKVLWYEALALFLGYFLYFTIMFQNQRISKWAHWVVDKFNNKGLEEAGPVPTKQSINTITSHVLEGPRNYYKETDDLERQPNVTDEIGENYTVFKKPTGTVLNKLYLYYTWPIRFLLYITVPDCRKFPRVFPISFVICVIWIGCNSYIVSWMFSIIGTTFAMPDSVVGLTFIAAGGCLPEAFSIAIMSRKGEGKLGVSNALGANTMNILLSLGLPWFIKTLVHGADEDGFISIESGSMEYTILTLIAVAICLYITMYFNKFHLSRLSGTITLVIYLAFLAFSIVSDLVIFPAGDCNEVA